MLFAAGHGTRLKPFTNQIAKPFVPVLGIPAIQYSVDWLRASGLGEFVVNIHHLPHESQSSLESLDWSGANFKVSLEADQVLGGAGGLKQAAPLLGAGTVLILNSDTLTWMHDPGLEDLLAHHNKMKARYGVVATIMTVSGSRSEVYTEVQTEAGMVTGLGKKKRGAWTYSGVALIEMSAVETLPAGQPADLVQSVLLPAIREQRVAALRCSKHTIWLDIGSPVLWAEAHFYLAKRFQKKSLPKPWLRRIAVHNKLVKTDVLCSKEHPLFDRAIPAKGPVYWSGTGSPKLLGPRAIVYGDVGPSSVQNTLVWNGLQSSLAKT